MKKISLLAFSIALLFLSGCITIIENYTFNKDGSGTMEYKIDMSELYSMMAAFSDSTQDMNLNDLDKSMQDALPGLQNIPGISNVVLTGNVSSFTAGVKFDFKDVNSLNKALAIIFEGEDNASSENKYVEMKGKLFTRYNLTSEEFDKSKLLGTDEIDEETMKSILESMKYKISVSFAKTVKTVKCQAPYTKDGKTVNIETNFSDIFSNTDFLKTTIKTR